MPVESADFTRTMSKVPAPVTVTTTLDASGQRWGFTGSSFTSLSLVPQLVLICLDKNASTHPAFTGAEHFLINVLAHEQADVAKRFATSGVDRFAAGDMVPCELGLPGLPEASARIACSTYDILDGGDHSILLGRVEETHTGSQVPLVYSDRAFGRPVPAGHLAVAR